MLLNGDKCPMWALSRPRSLIVSTSKKSDLEAALEGALVKEVKALGGLCVKITVKGERGWPDRLCLLPYGLSCYVEVKRPDGKGRVSKLQQRKIAQLGQLGHRVVLLGTFSHLEMLIETFAMEIRASEMERDRKYRRAFHGGDAEDS
jgi:hypothetical protein